MNREIEAGRERERPERERPGRERPRLDPRQLQTVEELGKFRLIDLNDLAKYSYGGDVRQMRADLNSLTRDGAALVEVHSVIDRKLKDAPIQIAFLTARGREALPAQGLDGQRYEIGRDKNGRLKKAGELLHDAAIYTAYQKSVREIADQNGRVTRVVLDGELKGQKARLTNGRGPDGRSNAKPDRARLEVIAREMGLKVTPVNRGGKIEDRILIPDVRIEYVTDSGDTRTKDIEVTTSTYKAGGRGEKAAAGFSLHASSGVGSGAQARGGMFDHHPGAYSR